MKKAIRGILATALAAGTILSSTVVSFAAEEDMAEGKIYTLSTTYFDLTSLPDEAITAYEESGWIINKDYSYRKTNLTTGELWVNGNVTTINSDGSFEVPQDTDTITVKYTEDGEEQTISKNADGNFEVVNAVNLESLMDRMDTVASETSPMARKGYGDKYYYGDWVHCNRFNGPLSDSVHYAKTNPKAYINFINSDCDIALANSTVCWGWSYCNQSGPAAGCSIEIGHYNKFHQH